MNLENTVDKIHFIRDGFGRKFKGMNQPITVELAADIWIEFLTIQNLLMDVAKMSANNISHDERTKHYLNFVNGLEASFEHIQAALERLEVEGRK